MEIIDYTEILDKIYNELVTCNEYLSELRIGLYSVNVLLCIIIGIILGLCIGVVIFGRVFNK